MILCLIDLVLNQNSHKVHLKKKEKKVNILIKVYGQVTEML
jgi:hypothetical protein